eukprot:3727757-Amphidinium_carterae.1
MGDGNTIKPPYITAVTSVETDHNAAVLLRTWYIEDDTSRAFRLQATRVDNGMQWHAMACNGRAP